MNLPKSVPAFDRNFFLPGQPLSRMRSGDLGGKASGLAMMAALLEAYPELAQNPKLGVFIPQMTVIATDAFDEFMEMNGLWDVALDPPRDDRLAQAFQKGELPFDLAGDLRALAEQVRVPLAVRSSSLLEDALDTPFAGVYATKMIPNHQPKVDARHRHLMAAVKLVYASTFFAAARAYRQAMGLDSTREKMAVIIQEVVGNRFDNRFYPMISGVARSHNFYPSGKAKPEHGIVDLALGLGKTIVDGGQTWRFSPRYPAAPPPFNNLNEMMKNTQTRFWAVNMGNPTMYDPVQEAEFLTRLGLDEADYDNTLRWMASTLDARSDRLVAGTGVKGPRILTFAPILDIHLMPLNKVIKALLAQCEEGMKGPVEVEFAIRSEAAVGGGEPWNLGFLQMRPMRVAQGDEQLAESDMEGPHVILNSRAVLGHGVEEGIRDIIMLDPDAFDLKLTPRLPAMLERMNQKLLNAKRPYLLMGFGRWGTSDPWCGVPVTWGQISGARVIVELGLPDTPADLSQGSHFFHNITGLRIAYLSVPHDQVHTVNWDWLSTQPVEEDAGLLRHLRLPKPLHVQVDGLHRRGVVRFEVT